MLILCWNCWIPPTISKQALTCPMLLGECRLKCTISLPRRARKGRVAKCDVFNYACSFKCTISRYFLPKYIHFFEIIHIIERPPSEGSSREGGPSCSAEARKKKNCLFLGAKTSLTSSSVIKRIYYNHKKFASSSHNEAKSKATAHDRRRCAPPRRARLLLLYGFGGRCAHLGRAAQ